MAADETKSAVERYRGFGRNKTSQSAVSAKHLIVMTRAAKLRFTSDEKHSTPSLLLSRNRFSVPRQWLVADCIFSSVDEAASNTLFDGSKAQRSEP